VRNWFWQGPVTADPLNQVIYVAMPLVALPANLALYVKVGSPETTSAAARRGAARCGASG